MELTPQLLTDEIDFRIAVRGYDRNEVDDFLERVAIAVGQLQDQLGKAVERARRAEAKAAEAEKNAMSGRAATAPPAQPEPVAEVAPEPAPEPVAEVAPEPEASTPTLPSRAAAPAPSDPAVQAARDAEAEDLNEELRRTLVLAQRTADTAVREANEEAERIVDDARARAQATLEQADADALQNREEARGRLVAEITELEAVREALRADAGILERYLGDERARVRETIQVLRRLVDDPRSFQVGTEPELSGARAPVDTPALAATPVVPALEAPASEVPASEPVVHEGVDQEAAPVESEVPEIEAEAPESERPQEQTPEVVAPPHAVQPPPSAPTSTSGRSRTSGDISQPPAGRTPPPVEAPAAPVAEPAADTTEASAGSSGELFSGPAEDDLGRLFDTGEHSSVDWRAPGAARPDQGPHTQPVAAARFEQESDDAFLAELRKAMTDAEPLGPDDGGAKR